MARPLRIAFRGAFYHVSARGNERKAVFRMEERTVMILCVSGCWGVGRESKRGLNVASRIDFMLSDHRLSGRKLMNPIACGDKKPIYENDWQSFRNQSRRKSFHLSIPFGQEKLLTSNILKVILQALHGGMPMPNIKTAISIDKPLLDQVDDLAKNLNISRSRLLVIAAQEFIQRHTNIELLRAINEAYDELPDLDTGIVERMRPRHLKMVKNQW